MIEYPKSLYLKGWEDLDAHVIVYSKDEESDARAKGYKCLADPVEEKRKPGRPRKEQ